MIHENIMVKLMALLVIFPNAMAQTLLCKDSAICPKMEKCGLNLKNGFVPFNDETVSKYDFIDYLGEEYGLCVSPVPTITTTTSTQKSVPTLCTADNQCPTKTRCGKNSENGFVPLNGKTALIHDFYTIGVTKYAMCVVPRTTATTTKGAEPVWCRGAGVCPAGKKCGMNHGSMFVPLNEHTAKKHDFFLIGGNKYGLCVVPATTTTRTSAKVPKTSIFEEVLVKVHDVHLTDPKTQTLFEDEFTMQSGALSGIYSYSKPGGHLRRKLSSHATTTVEAILEYESKAIAEMNIKNMQAKSFGAKLVAALQGKDSVAFKSATVSPVKVHGRGEEAMTMEKLSPKKTRRASTTSTTEARDPPSFDVALVGCGIMLVAIISVIVAAVVTKILNKRDNNVPQYNAPKYNVPKYEVNNRTHRSEVDKRNYSLGGYRSEDISLHDVQPPAEIAEESANNENEIEY